MPSKPPGILSFVTQREAGVYLPPSAFEAWFVSAAHDDEALSRMSEALPGAARAAATASPDQEIR